MKAFMDDDFFLGNQTSKTLYHEFAAPMPIIDYHCHINPAEIAQNRRFDNVAQLWIGGDHYKWRLIRANGEGGKGTAESSGHDQFLAFARALPKAAGNPVYHWTHLELKRYFDCPLTLSPDTAEEIWQWCNKKLAGGGFSVRDIIRRSRVEVIATTDDPADSLEWHRAIAGDPSFSVRVVPTFRPDGTIHIKKPGFVPYLARIGKAAGIPVKTLDDLYAVLENRMDFFGRAGCRASDHALDTVPFVENAEEQAPKLFGRALSGESLTAGEAETYQAAMLLFLGRAYKKRGWVMQLHYGAQRNVNGLMHQKFGPDTGYDAISCRDCSQSIAALLNSLGEALPKTVLYSLNPNDNAMLVSVCGCFTEDGVPGKVQQGCAWWFNDTKHELEAQLVSLAGRGLLGSFIGMLTDSRSFLSYTRHEYFRRILCNLLGTWVENGEYPADIPALGRMVQDISYSNTKKYFEL